MNKRNLQGALLWLTFAGVLACDAPPRVSMPTGPTVPSVTTPLPTPGENTAVRRISIGDVVTSTLRSGDPYCTFNADDLTAPCERYSIAVPQAGTVVIRVTWGNPTHFLQVVLPRANYRGGINCCFSPHVERIAAAPGGTYESRCGSSEPRTDRGDTRRQGPNSHSS